MQMNAYWIIAFLALLGGVFYLGDEYGSDSSKVECDKQDKAQQQNTITAQQKVITKVEDQGNISQEATKDYATDSSNISALYDADSGAGVVQQPAGTAVNHPSTLPAPACGTQTTKRYKLTQRQCDQEEAKCARLWDWAEEQADLN